MCPICQNSENRPFGRSVTGQTLLICSSCRHVYFETMPSVAEIVSHYEDRYTEGKSQVSLQEANRTYYSGHVQDLLHWVNRDGAPQTVVDFGSSIPVLCEEALRHGFRDALAVDYSHEAAQWGAQHAIKVIAPDDFPAPEHLGQTGVIRYSHVLEHLMDPLAIMRRHAACLHDNGLVYLTQPIFPLCAPTAFDGEFMDSVWPEHLHFFNMHSLTLMLQQVGLEIVEAFAFQNADLVYAKFADVIDEDTARERLAHLPRTMPQAYDSRGGYPTYVGENVSLLARRAN